MSDSHNNKQEEKVNAEEIIQAEKDYVLGVFGRPPFVLTEGKGCTVYDSTGKAYLDLVAGIAVNVLGYSDAEVDEAIKEAASTGMYHTSNLYHTEPHTRPGEETVRDQLRGQGAFQPVRGKRKRGRVQVRAALCPRARPRGQV